MPSDPAVDDEDGPRRSRLSASDREKQLLDVAEALFTRHGYEGVSVEDIARSAGVTRPTVYQHYGSRENLFLACVRRAREELERSIDLRVSEAGSEIEDVVRAGGSAYFDLIVSDRGRWAVLFTTSASLQGAFTDELTALRATTVEASALRVRKLRPDLSDEAAGAFAFILSGIGEQLGRWWIENPRVSRKVVLDYYVTAVLGAADGVLALPRAQQTRP